MAVLIQVNKEGLTDVEQRLAGAVLAAHQKTLRTDYKLQMVLRAVDALVRLESKAPPVAIARPSEGEEDQYVVDGLRYFAETYLGNVHVDISVAP
jgi:hypothetical protein